MICGILTLTNSDLNLKVLRSRTKTWQPKLTAISEKKSLSRMSLVTFFDKLKEHELELSQLKQHEEQEKKHMIISLKAKADSCDTSEKIQMKME
ncbi:hypothetical protein Lal_00033442 [Lupinus albus]|nr:hypothetical protein Lal_00033442 [Lupinus albus]